MALQFGSDARDEQSGVLSTGDGYAVKFPLKFQRLHPGGLDVETDRGAQGDGV